MPRTSILSHTLAPIAVGILAFSALPAAGEEPEPIAANPFTERHAFPDDVSMNITQDLEGLAPQEIEIEDASHMVVVEFTIQPGAVFPWHTHPGTVLIKVAEGDFVFMFAEDCMARDYAPGEALIDPGDTVHTAYNPSEDEETVVMATLVGVPAEGPLTIPVDEEENAALDAECGIER